MCLILFFSCAVPGRVWKSIFYIVDRAILKTKYNVIYHHTLRCYILILWVAMYAPAYTELWTTPSYWFYAFINIWCLLYNGRQYVGSSDSGSWLRIHAICYYAEVVTWTREEWSECTAHRWEHPHKLYIIRMLDTCTVHRWWSAEICIKCAFSGEFFALLPGIAKKQQEIESANCENRNPWPRLPLERLFSVAFFFFWVSTSTTRSAYSLFSIQDVHKKPKYMNKGTACELQSYNLL